MRNEKVENEQVKKEYRPPTLEKRERLVEVTEGFQPGGGVVTP